VAEARKKVRRRTGKRKGKKRVWKSRWLKVKGGRTAAKS
jgi:hypothetical protein